MKKTISVLTTVLLLAAVMTMSVFATTGGAAASEVAGQAGQNAEVYVSIDGFADVTSLSVSYLVPDGLTLVGAEWVQPGRLSNVDVDKQRAVWTSGDPVDMSTKTDVFKLIFSVLEPEVGQTDLVEEIQVNVTVISGADQRTELTAVGKVTVSYPATSVTLGKTAVTLDMCGTITEQLTAVLAPVNTTDKLSWASSDSSVVSVDENGKITGLKYGTAVITATAGNVSAQCEVTVGCSHTGNLQEHPANPASCENTGNNLYYQCDTCRQYLDAEKKVTTVEEQTLPKQEHSATHHDAVTANCGSGGNVEYWHCSGCKKNYADNICTLPLETVDTPVDPDNHVGETELRDVAANSCYKDGYTGDTYCKTCNNIKVPGQPIAATNNHIADQVWHTDGTSHWHVCTTTGCGKELEKAEHRFQWAVDDEATEYKTGLKHEECSCGAKRNENTEIPKLDHVHKDIKHYDADPATCVKEGTVEYWTCGSDLCEGKYYGDEKCQLVLTTIVDPIDPTNHVGETEVKDAAVASCFQNGYTGDTYCKSCNKIKVAGTVIQATNNHVADTVWHTDGTYHWHVCTTTGCDKELDKEKHTFQWKEDKEATEYETGLKHEECSCGAKRSENTEIPKKPHVHKDIKHYDAVPATCVKEGTVEYWTCGSDLCEGKYYGDDKCQQVLSTIVDPIDPDNHVGETEVKDAAVNSCFQDGYTGDTYCKTCGAKTVTGEVIYATNDHVADDIWHTDGTNHWHVCTTAGCGKELEKAEHRFQWKVDKEATEYETGLKHEECACGVKRSEDTVIPKLDHVHKDIKHYSAVPATCVKEGTVEYWTCGSDLCEGKYYGDEKCQLLLTTIVDPIDPAHHAGGKEVKDKVKATCGAAGYTGDTYCADCGGILKEGFKTPATGKHTPKDGYQTSAEKHWQVCSQCDAKVGEVKHTLEWIVDQEPTEESEGKKHQKCSVCDYICSENTVIEKLKHDPRLVTGRAPTCTEDGVAEHFLCDACGRYYASDNGSVGEQITADKLVLKAAGHSYAETWISDAKSHWHACSCGAVADKAEHSQTLVGAVEATDKTPGHTGDSVCSVCGYLIAAGQEIPCTNNTDPGMVILVVGIVLAAAAVAVVVVLIVKKKR